jgi:predicted small lipoprotein YifL
MNEQLKRMTHVLGMMIALTAILSIASCGE